MISSFFGDLGKSGPEFYYTCKIRSPNSKKDCVNKMLSAEVHQKISQIMVHFDGIATLREGKLCMTSHSRWNDIVIVLKSRRKLVI